MTAVDHTELKRLAECLHGPHEWGYRDPVEGGFIEDDRPYRASEALYALLSEIEGLKAERDAVWAKVEETARRYARCYPEASDGRNTFVMFAEWAASEAALRTQAPDSWRPIETAPRDGTWIQAWRTPPGFTGGTWEPLVYVQWGDDEEAWVWPDETYEVFTVRGRELADMKVSDCESYQDDSFTHWMPLPAAPALRPQTAESGECGVCFECLKDERDALSGFPITAMRMIVCPDCGNKRCPKATNHDNACTGSNEPGQPGSRYA